MAEPKGEALKAPTTAPVALMPISGFNTIPNYFYLAWLGTWREAAKSNVVPGDHRVFSRPVEDLVETPDLGNLSLHG